MSSKYAESYDGNGHGGGRDSTGGLGDGLGDEDLELMDIDEDVKKFIENNCSGSTKNDIERFNFRLVPDTNVFISMAKTRDYGFNSETNNVIYNVLHSMQSLKKSWEWNDISMKIVIPMTVLKELDSLKQSSTKSNNNGIDKNHTGHYARNAIKFIVNIFESKFKQFCIGQTPKESQEANLLYNANQHSDNNSDNKILNCARQLQSRLNDSFILLLTNDENLKNFAHCCGQNIVPMSEKDLMDRMSNSNGSVGLESILKEWIANISTINTSNSIKKTNNNESQSNDNLNNCYHDSFLQDSISQCLKLSSAALYIILVAKFKSDFGESNDIWSLVGPENPNNPRDVYNLVAKRHWTCFMQDVLSKQTKDSIDTLEYLLKGSSKNENAIKNSDDNIKIVLDCTKDIIEECFQVVSKSSNYYVSKANDKRNDGDPNTIEYVEELKFDMESVEEMGKLHSKFCACAISISATIRSTMNENISSSDDYNEYENEDDMDID